MAPPPKPPVICYDLHGGARPVCQRRYMDSSPNVYVPPIATSCSTHRQTENYTQERNILTTNKYRPSYNSAKFTYNDSRSCPTRFSNNSGITCFTRPMQQRQQPIQVPQAIFAVSGNSIFAPANNPTALRQAYANKLRSDNERKERCKAHEQSLQALRDQLRLLEAELNHIKQCQNHVTKTFGLGHNAAKHIEKQDEEIAQLKQKIEQSNQLHQKERHQQMQQMERLHELLKNRDQAAEKKLAKDLTNLAHHKENVFSSTLNGSISPPSSDQTTTSQLFEQYSSLHQTPKERTSYGGSQGSSSTLSLTPSSSSSPSSSQSSMHITSSTPAKRSVPISNRFPRKDTTHIVNATRQQLPQRSILSNCKNRTRTHQNSNTPMKNIQFSTPIEPRKSGLVSLNSDRFHDADFNFGESTLEVTDVNFFHKVEDQTMMEMDALMDRMKTRLNDLAQL